MRLDAGRQAAFARSASDRYERGERKFKPVVTDAMINFLQWTKSQSLIRLRRDFIPEIVKTGEGL